jgi:uncharacterized protein (DUF305 family)
VAGPVARPGRSADPRRTGRRRATIRSLAAVLVGLLLAGCGSTLAATTGTARTAPPLDGSFNDTDVMVLQMLVPHHEQGVELARLASTRASDADVRDLAAAVAATQGDELTGMRALLRDWNQPVAADPDPHAHATHGGLHTTDPEVVVALRRTAAGPEFDRTFLNLFTGHQLGAVEMARMEARSGRQPAAVDLAERIVRSRTAQIQQMARLLDR